MGVNPFGDAEVAGSTNPFGDAEVVSGPSPLEQPELGAGDYLSKLGQSAQAAGPVILALPSHLAQIATDIVRPVTTPIAQAVGVTDPMAWLGDTAKAEAARLEAKAKALAPSTEGMGAVATGIVNAPQSVVQTLAAAPAALLMKSPAPLLAAMGGITGGQAYSEARDAGKGVTASLVHGGSQAAVEVGTEMLGMPNFMKVLTGKTGLLTEAGKFLGKELAGEELATALQDLNDWATLHPEKPFTDYLAERPDAALQTFGGVLAGSSMQVGGAAAVNKGAQGLNRILARQEELMQVRAELSGGLMGDYPAQLPATAPANTGGGVDVPSPELNAGNTPSAPDLTPSRPSDSIPDTPLTPAEEAAATQQLKAMREGTDAIPEHAEGVAALSNLNDVLALREFKATSDEEIQARAQDILDQNPNIGQSKAERRAREEFPNSLPADQRAIAWSTSPGEVGLTSRQVPPQAPGTVRVLGSHEDQYSPELTDALGSTVQQWATKYLDPQAKVILNLSGLTGNAVGAHVQLADGTHVITPEELVRTQTAEEGGQLVAYNQFTQSEMFGGLTHEFGHALLPSQFQRDLPPEFQGLIAALDANRYYKEPELARMPEAHQQVVRDFQDRKFRILQGQMPAQELMDNWVGTWKVGEDLLKRNLNEKSLYTLAKRVLADVSKENVHRRSRWADGTLVRVTTLERATALDLIHAMHRDTSLTEAESNAKAERYFLSFNEFFAEQFSRYAHSEQIYKGTALGHYFERMLATLRNFFREMKAEGIIKPGVAFKTWLDQTVRNRALEQTVAPKVKRARKPKVVKEKTDAEFVKEVVAQNVQHPTALDDLANDEEQQAVLRKQLTAVLPPMEQRTPAQKKLARAAIDALKMGDYLGFDEIMQELAPTVRADLREETPSMKTSPTPEGFEDVPYNVEDLPYFVSEEVRKVLNYQRFVPSPAYYAALDRVLLGQRNDLIDIIETHEERFGYPILHEEERLRIVHEAQLGGNLEEFRPLAFMLLRAGYHSKGGLAFDMKDAKEDVKAAEDAVDAQTQVGTPLKESRWAEEAVNFLSNLKHYTLQIQQLAHTEANAGLRIFSTTLQHMFAMKNSLMAEAKVLAEQWEHLSAEATETFERILREEYESGGHMTELQQNADGRWEHKAGKGMYDFLKKHGLDPTTSEGEKIAQLILDYKNSILEHIDAKEKAALDALKHRYRKAPLVMRQKAMQVREAASTWRNAPYLPQGHFGDFVVKVWGTDPKTGVRALVHVEHFETAALRNEAARKFRTQLGVDKVKSVDLPKTMSMQMTIPKDFVHTLADTGQFTDEQLEAVTEALTPIHTEKVFRILARDASKIAGGEPDMLRNYANWIEDSANATAKFVHGRTLTQAIAWTRQDARDADKLGDQAGYTKLTRLVNTMQRAKGFIMHPKDEFFKTRGFIAMSMLLWAPKTALMNLTGQLQTWAALTAEYGDVKGNQEYALTAKKLAFSGLTELDAWALGRATEEGLIDQGFGHFMAGLANAGNLARRVRKTGLGKAQRAFIDYGMMPFTAVEHVNRKMSLLSFFNLELEKNLERGLNPETARNSAFATASENTRLLQNDYAAGNRPAFMHGRRSLAMIFLSYPQYMLWIMSGGFERGRRDAARAKGETPRSAFGGMTMRMWLIFLALSGYKGIPGGEFLLGILQKLWNAFGGGDNLDLEARKFMQDSLDMNSMYWRNVAQRGLSHGIGGVDLSGSLSMGSPLPGMRLLAQTPKSGEELLGMVMEEFSGPFGSSSGGIADLLTADEIGLKELGRAIPGEVGALIRTVEAARSGLTDRKGALVLRDETGQARRATTGELIKKALGFTLSEESSRRHLKAEEKQIGNYWVGRRDRILSDYSEAQLRADRVLVDQVQKARETYNAEVPYPELRIKGKELHSHARAEQRAVSKAERDQVAKRLRGIQTEVQSVP